MENMTSHYVGLCQNTETYILNANCVLNKEI